MYIDPTELPFSTSEERIEKAKAFAFSYGQEDGAHHKMWVIDQMVRALTGCPLVIENKQLLDGKSFSYSYQDKSKEYEKFIKEHKGGWNKAYQEYEYDWDEGIAP